MGTITFTVFSGTFGARTKEYTVSDAHLDRLAAAWQFRLTTPENPTPTRNQALLAWAEHVMDMTKTDVLATEREVASATVTSINSTG